MLVSSFVLWLVLVLRAAALGLVVGIVPLAAAATLHERAKGMLEQTVKLLLAVVFSKALIFWALSVGSAYLAAVFPAAAGGAPVPNTTGGCRRVIAAPACRAASGAAGAAWPGLRRVCGEER